MRIIGIDPGTAIIGYGVIDCINSRNQVVAYGIITTSAKKAPEQRLLDIYCDTNAIINEFEPDCVAVERLFFSRNTTTAIAVAKASGVIQLAMAQKNLPLEEYTPMEVKQAVVGYGNAEKKQVQYMIQRILNLKEIPKPDDAADALAIAICHSNSMKLKNIGK